MSRTVVGIDIGYGDVKIVSDDLLAVTEKGCFVSFPTVIAPARAETFSVTEEENVFVEVGENKYCVGEDARESANVLNTKYETWFKDDLYLAFYKKALSYVTPGTIDVVTGLPVSDFDKWNNELKKRLTGEFKVNGKTYEVVNLRIMPQPFGSFSNYIFDSSGNLMNETAMKETVGIIDIGTRTTDFILVDSGKWKKEGASGTINTGVSNLLDKVSKQVSEIYKVDLTMLKVRDAIRSREIKVYGKPKDISTIIDQEVHHLAKFIEYTAKTFWGSGAHIDTVLLVGGGAEIFRKYMENLFPHLTVPKEISFSNAKGFWKYGVSINR